jgi:hypothetical protein
MCGIGKNARSARSKDTANVGKWFRTTLVERFESFAQQEVDGAELVGEGIRLLSLVVVRTNKIKLENLHQCLP